MVHLRHAPPPAERAAPPEPRASDEPEGPEAFSPEYWLAHCEGFRVDTAQGRLGIVEEVLLDDAGRPQALVVLGGALGQKRWIVSVDDIAVVQPRRERVGLADPFRPAGPPERQAEARPAA